LKRKKVIHEEEQTTSHMGGGEEAQWRTLRDFITLVVHGQTPSITMPPMVTNNFELKAALVCMVQQS